MSYISVHDLSKSFTVRKKREKGHLLREKTQIQALQNISFDIEKGELVGYIGPNGAGKSTTVKILSGILTPDSGNVNVGGMIPWKERKKHVRRIGVVFGQRSQLWWDVPIIDSYSLLRDIYRIPESDYQKRLNELTDELLEFVDEGKIGMRPAVELSYLQEEEMRDLVDFIDNEEVFPSHAQTIRMRALSKDGKLDREAIDTIMNEEKPNQKARIKIPMEKIEKYFPAGTSEKKIEETILKALAMYRQRQKENRDAR